MDAQCFDTTYLSHFNPQQREAVHAVDGPVLLLAVPGSGKTTVLVARLGYMLYCAGIPASKILTMTYTVAATEEMRRRFAGQFGDEDARKLKFCTINALALRIIHHCARQAGRPPFALLEDNSELLGELYRQVNEEFPVPGVVRELQKNITYLKNQMLTPEEIENLDTGIDSFGEIYRRYCGILRDRRQMDYDDQLVYAKTILETQPQVLAYFQDRYPYLCVDESQDTSKIQHAILRLLAAGHGNLFLVGDEDQSIYGFRGACPEALMRFEEDYPGAKVLLMEENYRSTPEILSMANGFVRKNILRRQKTIRPNRESGDPVQIIYAVSREAQYDYLALCGQHTDGSTAVLYRNNDSALPLIDLLDSQGIPFGMRSMEDTFFTSRLVSDIGDIIHFSQEPGNEELFFRIYYKLNCGIDRQSAREACRRSKTSGKPILWELLRQRDLKSFARESVTGVMDQLPLLQTDSAKAGLLRIWNSLGYGKYAKSRGTDLDKSFILQNLAARQPSLQALLDRLEALKELVKQSQGSREAKLQLSTIHSSKGLEYDTVYLLDLLDGILPKKPDTGQDGPALYALQEERRLFYVAMTRAKNKLYLFACSGCTSAFLAEVLKELPQQKPEDGDIFYSIRGNLCGRGYCHREHGDGVIRANCEDACLIAYENGTQALLPLGQMLAQRKVPRKKPEEDRPKEPPQQPTQERLSQAREGAVLLHVTLGRGTIVSYRPPYVTVRFSADTKAFDLPASLQKGWLRFPEKDE